MHHLLPFDMNSWYKCNKYVHSVASICYSSSTLLWGKPAIMQHWKWWCTPCPTATHRVLQQKAAGLVQTALADQRPKTGSTYFCSASHPELILSIHTEKTYGDKAVRLDISYFMTLLPKHLPHIHTLSCGSAWKCFYFETANSGSSPGSLFYLMQICLLPTQLLPATQQHFKERRTNGTLLSYCSEPRLFGIPPTEMR